MATALRARRKLIYLLVPGLIFSFGFFYSISHVHAYTTTTFIDNEDHGGTVLGGNGHINITSLPSNQASGGFFSNTSTNIDAVTDVKIHIENDGSGACDVNLVIRSLAYSGSNTNFSGSTAATIGSIIGNSDSVSLAQNAELEQQFHFSTPVPISNNDWYFIGVTANDLSS